LASVLNVMALFGAYQPPPAKLKSGVSAVLSACQ
jgi:hypothetical protein